MLETLRKQGASIVIYAVFGILIAVFVINFGAQSVGTSEGCRSSSGETVATVDGHDVGSTGWHWVNNFLSNFNRSYSKDERPMIALNWLIEREMLVEEAESRGLNVNDTLVDQNLKNGKLYFGGGVADALKDWFIDKDGFFVYQAEERTDENAPPGLLSLVRQLGLTIGGFKEQQRKETLAAMMIQMLAGEARASKDEALSRFVYEGTTATYDYVPFEPARYRDALHATDAEIDAWAAAHEKDVKAKFDANAEMYKKMGPQVHAREIFIAKAKAPEAGSGSASGSGSGTGSGSAAAPVDDGAQKLAAARADIIAKKKTFAEAAKALDSDENARARGGDLGWRQTDAPALGDPKLATALAALQPGVPSDVITTDTGSYLLLVEEKRQGPLSYEQVKRDIAADLAKDAWADEAARRAAIAALAEAKASKKSINELYPRAPEDNDGGQLQQMLQLMNDPNTPPELKQQIQKQLEQQLHLETAPVPPAGGGSGSTGRLEIESADVPAVWGADDQKAPAGGAAPPAVPPATDIMKPSTDPVPELGTLAKPGFVHVSPQPRDPHATGDSAALMTALFDQLTDGGYADRIFKIDGSYRIIQLVHKRSPELDQFDKKADDKVADLASERGIRRLKAWLHDRCAELDAKGKIKFEQALVNRSDENGHTIQVAYKPCTQFGADDEAAPVE